MEVPKKPSGFLLDFFDEFIRLLDVLDVKEQFSSAFEKFAKKIAAYMEAEKCLFYLCSDGENPFSPAFATKSDNVQLLMNFYFNRSIFEEVMGTGIPYVNNNFEGRIVDDPTHVITMKSVLCYPLIKQEKKVGLIEVINKLNSTGFQEEDKDFLNRLSRPLSVILDNASRVQNIELLCFLDDVTKLYNSRYLKQSIYNEIKRSLRYKKKVSLLFLDIDHFKRVNDMHGHLVGSETLMEVGTVLKSAVRGTDIVSRYGGDEFVLILPETSSDKAFIIAERIRDKIEKYRFGTKRNLRISLTVSIGVATCPKHALTAEGLIQKADFAMYQAKGTSKNSVCIAV